MKQKIKTRLPVGVVEKLSKNSGGGRHRSKKSDYRRQPKHRNAMLANHFDSPSLSSSSHVDGFVEISSFNHTRRLLC